MKAAVFATLAVLMLLPVECSPFRLLTVGT